jgi:hypothetical protein
LSINLTTIDFTPFVLVNSVYPQIQSFRHAGLDPTSRGP